LGYYQKDCLKCRQWFEKKGKCQIKGFVSVCFESNLTEVPSNTWWLDSTTITHVSNMMQEFLSIQTINPNENFMLMGNRVRASIETIGTYRLFFDTSHHLDLFQTFYVPSISRNLVSLPKLDLDGYFINFGNKSFSLFKNTSFVGSGILCDRLYKFKLNDQFAETLLTLHHNVGTKRSLINENSSNL
jgi:hypothetical protein